MLTLLVEGDARKELEASAKEYRISHQVEFAGLVDQQTIADTLQSSDVFVRRALQKAYP